MKLTEGLIVAVLVLLLLLALQGKTIGTLRDDLALKEKELTEAYKSLESYKESSDSTIKALERQLSERQKILKRKSSTNKKIDGVIENGKTSGTDVTVQLSDSMWLVYCEGSNSHCPSE